MSHVWHESESKGETESAVAPSHASGSACCLCFRGGVRTSAVSLVPLASAGRGSPAAAVRAARHLLAAAGAALWGLLPLGEQDDQRADRQQRDEGDRDCACDEQDDR